MATAVDYPESVPNGAASELAMRDSLSNSSPIHSLDLPSLLPLSHNHPLLAEAETFDVDAFLLSRIHIPLDELRGELRQYLGVLREELVQLINDDYEEFISLGTGLRGENERLKGLQEPLSSLRSEVEVVRDVLKEHQVAVQAKLDERAALREEKALLELLQRLFETLARAEALDTSTVDTAERPKVIQRLAGEYTQLVYLRDKASAEKCKIVETVSPRIDALRDRLSHDLSSILTAALEARDEPRIKQCLRTYDLIQGWREAEDVVRTSVKAFCSETIVATALVAPAEPVVPPTPDHARKLFERPNRLSDTSHLANLYNRILAQVDGYLPLINTAHHVSAEFDFFSKVLWSEISSAIVSNLGGVIFAAGRPDELHKHYTTTHRFLSLFEDHAPTADAVRAVRESQTYQTFERMWQLPVYFQLRWKEIVTKYEAALTATSTAETSSSTAASAGWAIPQTAAAWEAFRSCWSPDIYLPELTHRFWRLSMQVLSRYSGYLSTTLASFKVTTGDEPDVTQEDAALRFAGAAVSDIDALVGRIRDMAVLRELGLEVPLPKQLNHEAYAERIIAILQRRCVDPLKLVRSVASQFRATPSHSNQAVKPSHFVPTVLKPLHVFFDARPALKDQYASEWSTAVVDQVLVQYTSVLSGVRKTEDLLRRHRKSKKSGFSLFGASVSGGSGTDPSDEEERFKRQMLADADSLAADAKGLGVSVDGMASWLELRDVIERPAEV